MPNQVISSLHSPHVERVKALLHPRGKKLRSESNKFVVDSLPAIKGALAPKYKDAPKIESLYLTKPGLDLLKDSNILIPNGIEVFEITQAVCDAISDVRTSQGVIGIANFKKVNLEDLSPQGKFAYFWQLQDPGNAGTVIRSGDAAQLDGILFSDESVDIFSPKVVRSSAGSLWNVPVVQDLSLENLINFSSKNKITIFALDAHGSSSISSVPKSGPLILLFGNEARGLPQLPSEIRRVSIPMKGGIESFNVATAATIAMYEVALREG